MENMRINFEESSYLESKKHFINSKDTEVSEHKYEADKSNARPVAHPFITSPSSKNLDGDKGSTPSKIGEINDFDDDHLNTPLSISEVSKKFDSTLSQIHEIIQFLQEKNPEANHYRNQIGNLQVKLLEISTCFESFNLSGIPKTASNLKATELLKAVKISETAQTKKLNAFLKLLLKCTTPKVLETPTISNETETHNSHTLEIQAELKAFNSSVEEIRTQVNTLHEQIYSSET